MFFSKLFNKSKSTDNKVLICCHCNKVCDKLKKCGQCKERTICRDCRSGKYGRFEEMCKKCDVEYMIWLKKVELYKAQLEQRVKEQEKQEQYYQGNDNKNNKNNMAGALLQDYY